MSCHDSQAKKNNISSDELTILLMGNPNVGKSVFFSKLTGMEVSSSNYSGTTVSYTQGKIHNYNKEATLIDVPGTYSLQATSEAEKVAVDFVESDSADIAICVLDATNLERNLNFALQLKEHNLPVIFALNLIDVAEKQGIIIDNEKLSKKLGAPVIPTVAIRNIGLRELLDQVFKESQKDFKGGDKKRGDDQRWQLAEEIAAEVQNYEDREETFLEKAGNLTLNPLTGIPIAIIVLILSLAIVVGGGKGLRAVFFLPLVDYLVVPFFRMIVSFFISEGLLFNILVGEYGVFVKGIEWPFALVLPYVFLFYIVLSFLEDSGYLPRIGVLVDSVFRKLGIQGGNIVPLIMGYGCAIPAILGTRASTSKKERLVISSLVVLAVPCSAQAGAFVALLGDHSILALGLVYLISFAAMAGVGVVLNKIIPGSSDPMLLEVPNLLIPDLKSLVKKIWLRTKAFMIEAEIPMLLGVGFAALLVEVGLLESISIYLAPLTRDWLGLPTEATIGLMLGIIRRELAVLPLLELNLTTLQMVVGSVVALFYIPCISALGILIKEFGLKLALTIGFLTTFAAIFAGGLINQAANLFMYLF